ncbi:MAG: hypothetical protein ABSF63_03525 [Candidatus Bathyarchaeia archaeon]|jgi:hypothetical protein
MARLKDAAESEDRLQRLRAWSMELIECSMKDWRVLRPLSLKRKYAATIIEMIEDRVGADPYAEGVIRKLNGYLEELQPWIGKGKVQP